MALSAYKPTFSSHETAESLKLLSSRYHTASEIVDIILFICSFGCSLNIGFIVMLMCNTGESTTSPSTPTCILISNSYYALLCCTLSPFQKSPAISFIMFASSCDDGCRYRFLRRGHLPALFSFLAVVLLNTFFNIPAVVTGSLKMTVKIGSGSYVES